MNGGPFEYIKKTFQKHSIHILSTEKISSNKISAVQLGNTGAISRFFEETICKKYDKMFSQRAYIHWYIAEGMEEDEFVEARENLGSLIQDYIDMLSEQHESDPDE